MDNKQAFVNELCKRFVKGENVVVVCHPDKESIIREIAQLAGLVVVKVEYEYDQRFLDEDKAIIYKKLPRELSLGHVEVPNIRMIDYGEE